MAHPIEDYIRASGSTRTAFAARIGVSRRTLSRIIAGECAPKPAIARRIAEATGGAAPFGALYDGGGGRVADLGARRAEAEPLDGALLAPVLRFVLNGLARGGKPVPDALVEAAAEAVANTHDALARITTRTGPHRLAQALAPVFREIRRDCPALSLPEDRLDRAAAAAAALYFRAKPLLQNRP